MARTSEEDKARRDATKARFKELTAQPLTEERLIELLAEFSGGIRDGVDNTPRVSKAQGDGALARVYVLGHSVGKNIRYPNAELKNLLHDFAAQIIDR